MGKYNKNQQYCQEHINELIEEYNIALQSENKIEIKRILTDIYDFIKKYVYKILWAQYRKMMNNPYHREDIVQNVWLKIFSELKYYNPQKGAITTFINPLVKHVVSVYTSENFMHVSVYYANIIQKIATAEHYCEQHGLNINDLNVIQKITGLPISTIKNALNLRHNKNEVSYEMLVALGLESTSYINTPEVLVIQNEIEDSVMNIIHKVLTAEETEILRLLVISENRNKNHISYKEIADKLPGNNIKKIKRKILRIGIKLKSNNEFTELYPYIIKFLPPFSV